MHRKMLVGSMVIGDRDPYVAQIVLAACTSRQLALSLEIDQYEL
jgi:hypothetical protein